MTPLNVPKPPSIRRVALRLAIAYCVMGILWIAFSDRLAQAISPTPEVFAFIAAIKGWLFILVTTGALYYLISRMVSRVHQLDSALSEQSLNHQVEMGHYRLLLEASEDNIILFDTQKRYLAITDPGAATMERKASQMLGRTPTQVLDIQLGSAIEETLDMVIATQKPLKGMWKLHANNQQRWSEVVYNPVQDENGNLTAILAISRDVTAKTIASEKLTQQYKMLEFSEAEYRQILNSVDDMIYRIDAKGNQVYLNAKGREIEELSDDEDVFAPLAQFMQPDDNDRAVSAYRQQLDAEGIIRLETRMIGKRGRLTHVSHRAKLIQDNNGNTIGVLGVGRDVTQQKLQEEALATHARQQAAVAQIGQRVLEGVDTATLMTEVVNVVAEMLNVEIAGILELSPDKKELFLRAGFGWKEGYGEGTRFPIYPDMNLEPQIIEDVRADPRVNALTTLVDHHINSSIHVNIQGPDGLFGLLVGLSAGQRGFTQDDTHFLQAIANVLAARLVRARAEQALRDSAERNRAIVKTAGDGILTIDEAGIIESVNPTVERLFGYSASEVIGQNIDRLIVEPDNEVDEQAELYDNTSISKLNEKSMGRRKDGKLFPIDLTISEMQLGGRRMFTNIVRDITERVHSTQAVARHLRQLSILNHILQVASAPIGFERVLDVLLTEICEVFNADAADIHLMDTNVGLLYLLAHRGYDISEDEKYRHLSINDSLRGEATLKGHVVAYTEPFPANFQPLTEQITGVKAIAITPIWARGEIRGTLAIILWSERAFGEEDLALLEALGRGVGITIENARLYAEAQSYAETLKLRIDERTDELQKALVHAQSADRAKSALLNTVSHEMRTPLSSIIGFSSLILTRKPQLEKTLEFASAINAEARRLSELINDFLDLQRIESGREVFHRTDVDLADLIRDVVRKHPYDETLYTVKLNLAAMPYAYADGNRIRQVILNLLSNALKYSPNGGEIAISLRRDGNEAVFSIRDEGLGLAPADMAQVFEHFYRGEAAERLRIRGTGLGLGLCREIIHLHNGRIWCESQGQNLGSTFSFALPLRVTPRLRAGASDDMGNQKLIILIGDDVNFSSSLSEPLELDGYRTRTVPFKSATVNYLAVLKPVLVILDLVQANESKGWILLESLKASTPTASIPTLVCSNLGVRDQALRLGVSAYMGKSIDQAQFIHEVNRLVEFADVRETIHGE